MERSYLLDNAKVIMIYLVIIGHLIEYFIDNDPVLRSVYSIIYSFHMPVFIIISGMLFKGRFDLEVLRKDIRTIFIPFITFNLIYEALNIFTTGEISYYTKSIAPFWILWYLFSLLCWKLLVPIILNFKYPIVLSVIISISIGYVDTIGFRLGLSRTIYFFPFFLIGYKFGPEMLERIRINKFSKLISLMVLLMNFFFFAYFNGLDVRWLHGSRAYGMMNASGLVAGVTRLSFMSISVITSMSLLLLLPKSKSVITSRGAKTLYVYIWHGIIIKLIEYMGFFEMISHWNIFLISLVYILLGLLILFFFSSKFIVGFTTNYIFSPIERLVLNKKNIL